MELTESALLLQFYQDLQNGIPLDTFLPQLVTKKIITIADKLLITEYSKSTNERCRYFLDQFISKPISAGDPGAFYKLLQLMETSSQCIVLAARIKQCLMVGSMENKFIGMYSYVAIYQYKHQDIILILFCMISAIIIFNIHMHRYVLYVH